MPALTLPVPVTILPTLGTGAASAPPVAWLRDQMGSGAINNAVAAPANRGLELSIPFPVSAVTSTATIRADPTAFPAARPPTSPPATSATGLRATRSCFQPTPTPFSVCCVLPFPTAAEPPKRAANARAERGTLFR